MFRWNSKGIQDLKEIVLLLLMGNAGCLLFLWLYFYGFNILETWLSMHWGFFETKFLFWVGKFLISFLARGITFTLLLYSFAFLIFQFLWLLWSAMVTKATSWQILLLKLMGVIIASVGILVIPYGISYMLYLDKTTLEVDSVGDILNFMIQMIIKALATWAFAIIGFIMAFVGSIKLFFDAHIFTIHRYTGFILVGIFLLFIDIQVIKLFTNYYEIGFWNAIWDDILSIFDLYGASVDSIHLNK
ncbi:hypothetical protein [Veillonella criceti]|uniref:Uncharacterized protein n=1 Tax=Veillonella criceti TaxID=103891 RepID=A0A380NL39_9FIRM|nr:hypothetical protein [Veillonella criceti]SUP43758.1 Uncharacterised protein [Veillonella criceti]